MINNYQKLIDILNQGSYPDTCMEYWAALSTGGYGRCTDEGKPRLAHRVALEHKLGRPLTKDEMACHTCDNPKCYNPNHLWPGSYYDNMDDMRKKGRGPDNRGSKHGQTALKEQDVKDIITHKKSGLSQQDIASLYGVTQQAISYILKGKTWKHVTR